MSSIHASDTEAHLQQVTHALQAEYSTVQDDFKTIEVLNTAAKEKYAGVSDIAQKLVSHTAILHRNYEHLGQRLQQMSDLENSITQLETLVKELIDHTKRIHRYLNSS
ncbi:hypothetical protein BASA50_001086 [Batrachochytrium salamandrivorans]|uniref:Biogenesis of lysosome-related organelles complex 1 subunit 2 n=1 Tax=Batrachochytrium salamandrivorans TaxID=1357716 RepID=A0ABQ8ES43_9FUNG|nr:hypothetical protein BASA62_003561 [Batrachochytrium salamandrivorans]KAH6580530.1 hypothetical protein BASA60_002815 [Batrachochytrium salamandrivorans]KAH6585477.1 hypothetical protein BASA50_001086 [Batrachochytrium salamandrivorans]KAH6591157.1 hypothetical protein BASA61_005057 [Batrachochytrium salamandrivorans]KAH9248145.1 hypothetical protein BASA81_014219 [Batrachochytrium salamandrivorans]